MLNLKLQIERLGPDVVQYVDNGGRVWEHQRATEFDGHYFVCLDGNFHYTPKMTQQVYVPGLRAYKVKVTKTVWFNIRNGGAIRVYDKYSDALLDLTDHALQCQKHTLEWVETIV